MTIGTVCMHSCVRSVNVLACVCERKSRVVYGLKDAGTKEGVRFVSNTFFCIIKRMRQLLKSINVPERTMLHYANHCDVHHKRHENWNI